MNKIQDVASSMLARAGDILFVQNPRGTSLGVFSGVSADGAIKFFSPALRGLRTWVDPERVSCLFWISAGVVAFNVPHLLRRRQLPDSIENAFEVIRRLKHEGVSSVQIRMHLVALLNEVVSKVNLDQDKLRRTAGEGSARRRSGL